MGGRWRVAAALLAILSGNGLPGPASAQTFKSGIQLVTLGVTITDRKGAFMADLKVEDFEVYEDGHRQDVRYFAPGRDVTTPAEGDAVPVHLGLLFDTSESMGEDLRFTRTAAIKFLNTLVQAVDITLVDFDTEVRVARYGQSDFPRLVERIRSRAASGMTSLYDAIGVYLNGAEGQDGRKIMLLYTDGGDTRSASGFADTLTLLKASDVTVYVIGELEHQSQSAKNEQRMLLQQMAEVTGGQAFVPSGVKELDAAYAKVLAEIRAQYQLGYLSTNEKADGAWRKVDVKLSRPSLKDARVRSRKGYFGPFKKPDGA